MGSRRTADSGQQRACVLLAGRTPTATHAACGRGSAELRPQSLSRASSLRGLSDSSLNKPGGTKT